MEYQGDIGLYLSGEQVLIRSCGIVLTQPSIKTIVQFGETDFMVMCNTLSNIPNFVKSIKEGNSALADKPDFQLFIEIMRDNAQRKQILPMFDDFFNICFPDVIFSFSKHSIDFKVEPQGSVIGQINRGTYVEFSRVIKEVFLPPVKEEAELNINENDAMSRRLKEKIMRNRERLKKLDDKKSVSVFALYASTLSIGLQLPITTFYDYTPFQLYDSFRRFMLQQQYDQWFKISTVPFADTSNIEQPKQWISDIYSKDNFVDDNVNSFSKFNQVVGD